MTEYLSCDLCLTENPRFVLEPPGSDGPLVECVKCGLRYIGLRRSGLTFGTATAAEITEKVKHANVGFQNLRLEEEHRLALLNAIWRLDLIREMRPSGSLLEIGCARGDFLSVARRHFDVRGVEPNPELAEFARRVAPVHADTIENTPWSGFDVIASFHVIEHVDSPNTFVAAAAQKLKPGGLLVLETPDINSIPFRIFRRKWRQFIPEHYYFFDSRTIRKLLERHGLRIERMTTVGKYASMEFILNRLSRHLPFIPVKPPAMLSHLTFRVNPRDIMLVFASRQRS